MIIFSSSVSTILTLAPFPAWAIVSLSFVLPASFLFLIGLDSAIYYIASDALIRRYLFKHKDQFELFRTLGYAKASDIVEQKIRKQLDPLENISMFTSMSEREDTKKYIENVVIEMEQYHTKTDDSKSE